MSYDITINSHKRRENKTIIYKSTITFVLEPEFVLLHSRLNYYLFAIRKINLEILTKLTQKLTAFISNFCSRIRNIAYWLFGKFKFFSSVWWLHKQNSEDYFGPKVVVLFFKKLFSIQFLSRICPCKSYANFRFETLLLYHHLLNKSIHQT